MALTKRPPTSSLWELYQSSPQLLEKLNTDAVREFFLLANERYLHWEALHRRPLPPELSPVEAWAGLRQQRRANFQDAPVPDKDGILFHYWLTPHLQQSLHLIDRKAGQVFGSDEASMPDRSRYVISSLMDEAISSSRLEGAATTRRVAKEMLRSGRKPLSKAERMIWNNWRTIQHLCETRTELFSPEGVLHLHAMITAGTLDEDNDAGRLRTDNDIVIVDYRDGEVVHVPPSHDSLEERLQQLCDFANHDDEKNWIHPVVKAILLHFWLAYDHPFIDGNGRTARALFYWYLLSRGYWLFEYLSISRYFLRAPLQYARSFQEVETDGNDLTYFLHFNLRVIRMALDDLHLYLEKQREEERASTRIAARFADLNDRQRALLHHAAQHEEETYTIAKHRATHDIAYGTARSDLLGLAERNLLQQRQHGKAFVFAAPPDLKRRLNAK